MTLSQLPHPQLILASAEEISREKWLKSCAIFKRIERGFKDARYQHLDHRIMARVRIFYLTFQIQTRGE